MELRHLRYFLKVAEEKNFSKAAEKLFISQPPLSRQIKELEQELAARLFNRNNKKVELTNAGIFFEKEAREILARLDKAKLKTHKIAQNVSGEFNIAYISSTFSGTISDLIKHLSGLYPYANFKLYEIGTQRQLQELEQGILDLGILRAPVESSKVNTNQWFKDGFAFVYNKNLLQINSHEDIEKLKNETFVFFNKEVAPEWHKSLLKICAMYGFEPNIVHESNNINSITQLVRNGLGVSIVPASLAKNQPFPELGFMEIDKTEMFTEIMIATPKDEQSEIAESAVNFLTKSVINNLADHLQQ